MKLSSKDYKNFTKALKKINDTAGSAMEQYITKYGMDDVDALVRYGYGVSSVYGNASASLAAAMYDEIASLEKKVLPAAELAENPEFGEVAQAIQGTLKQSINVKEVSGAVSRLVKRTGQDTLIKNGQRDGAEFAWVPIGDTCPLCKTIASRGWTPISKKSLKNGHAEHIHANCDCSYMIRHDSSFNVEGYKPEKYLEEYENAEGNTAAEKINSMRRMQYAERKDVINAQKRAAYAARKSAIKAAQSDGDSKQPLSIKGNFEDFKKLNISETEKTALTNLYNKAKETGYEHGMAYYEGGQTEIQSSNNHNTVIIKYPTDAKNIELMHCHTDESPLSTEDLRAFVNPNVNKTQIVTANGDVWSADIGYGIRPTQKEFADAVKECYNEAKATIESDPEFVNWTAEERYYMLVREKMLRIGRYFEWDISGGLLNE